MAIVSNPGVYPNLARDLTLSDGNARISSKYFNEIFAMLATPSSISHKSQRHKAECTP